LRITVIGCGYLGATHAACMAELGFDVLGVDTDADRVDLLAQGRAPFYEPGLDDLLAAAVVRGRLRFTTSYERAAEFGDVHFLCVATPQRDGELAADLSYVYSAVDTLAPLLRGPCVVAGKSTVPVGTAAQLAERFTKLSPAGSGVSLAWNPEFLREGHGLTDTLQPDRLVFGLAGGPGGAAEVALRSIYAAPIAAGTPVVVCDLATAEFAVAWNRQVRAAVTASGAALIGDLEDLPVALPEGQSVPATPSSPDEREVLAAGMAAQGMRPVATIYSTFLQRAFDRLRP